MAKLVDLSLPVRCLVVQKGTKIEPKRLDSGLPVRDFEGYMAAVAG
jgi:hypothetical protein